MYTTSPRVGDDLGLLARMHHIEQVFVYAGTHVPGQFVDLR